ncbi:MAG TPA: HEAT repeat domain-containing protein [Longimicrobiales bacterium]|nr:HEAT repeat domain-containing protein [Longimicrobiales bacterium]
MIDYRLDLVTVVAKIRDPRTVGLLLPWLQNGGEAQSAIISFGEVAVPELIRLLDDTNQHQRWGAARTLGMIANSSRNQLNSSSFEAIKVALLQTLRHEEDWLLRLSAVNALAAYSTDDVRNEMERLSRGDTASVGDGDRRKYPVRDAARAWLSTHPK